MNKQTIIKELDNQTFKDFLNDKVFYAVKKTLENKNLAYAQNYKVIEYLYGRDHNDIAQEVINRLWVDYNK